MEQLLELYGRNRQIMADRFDYVAPFAGQNKAIVMFVHVAIQHGTQVSRCGQILCLQGAPCFSVDHFAQTALMPAIDSPQTCD